LKFLINNTPWAAPKGRPFLLCPDDLRQLLTTAIRGRFAIVNAVYVEIRSQCGFSAFDLLKNLSIAGFS